MEELKLNNDNINDYCDEDIDLYSVDNIGIFNKDEHCNKMNSGDSIYTSSTIFSSDKSSRSSINLSNTDNCILLKSNNTKLSTKSSTIDDMEDGNSILSFANNINGNNLKDDNKFRKLTNNITLMFINRLLPNMTIEDYNKFILAYLSYMVLYSTRKPFSVVKLQIQEDLSLSTSILGWIDTTFLGSYAVGQLIVPTFFDSTKINEYVSISFILSSISSLIFGMSNNSTTLLISWFFNGLFHSGVYPMLIKYLISCFGVNERGRILGVWTTSQQLGAIISTAFSASICLSLGWRFVFYIPSLLVFFFGIVVYKYLRQPVNQYIYDNIFNNDKNDNALNNNNLNGNSTMIMMENNELNIQNIRETLQSSSSSLCFSETSMSVLKYEIDSIDINNNDISMIQEEKLDNNEILNNTEKSTKDSDLMLEEKNINDEKSFSDEKTNLDMIYSYSAELSPTIKKKYSTREKEDNLKDKAIDNNGIYSSFHIQNIQDVNTRQKFFILLNIPNIFNISVSYFFVKLIRYSLLFWLPYYLIRELNYDPSIAGYSSMLFDVGGILGAISAGAIADIFFDGRRILIACYMSILITSSILYFILITRTTHNIFILFGIIFMGFCISGPDSILGSTAAQDILDNSGIKTRSVDSMATGIVNGLGSLGAVTQGTLTAYISEYYGWNALFFCLSIFATLSFFILLPASLNRKHKIVV